jgi:hypothetical protein
MSQRQYDKWNIKVLNSHFANCLWSDSEGNNKYHLANWESVSMLKEFGGLGIPSLRPEHLSASLLD